MEQLKGLKPSAYQWGGYRWPKTQNSKARPTGVKFLDDFIGGLVPGEIYSCLGPIGTGKTTMAIQLAATVSLQLQKIWVESERTSPLGKVFYVTTDDGRVDIQRRMLSYGAVVDKDQISGTTTPLTTKETMSDADHALADDPRFRAAYSETDRLHMIRERFRDNLRIIDLLGKSVIPENMHPITYVRQQIEIVIREVGNICCALIIIDHCETLISRLAGLPKKNTLRSEVTKQLPRVIKDQLATRFSCPVWAVHQITGEANEKAINARITHEDAKGSPSWGDDFNACFSISQIDRETDLCRLSLTKNSGGLLLPDKTLKLIGKTGTLIEQEKYVLVNR